MRQTDVNGALSRLAIIPITNLENTNFQNPCIEAEFKLSQSRKCAHITNCILVLWAG